MSLLKTPIVPYDVLPKLWESNVSRQQQPRSLLRVHHLSNKSQDGEREHVRLINTCVQNCVGRRNGSERLNGP